ncbi:MAG: beta-lactamase family protein [Propionibacteriales bacterium]|nr:beta-lactamase family protein [Propionibacteriales bacterium]
MADVAAAIRRLEDVVPRLHAEYRIPGMAVGLCDISGILWSRGFGTTSADTDQPVTTATRFSIQSCSKMYTALCVLLAVRQGLLDLDRPITDYLPGFRVNSVFEDRPELQITLRHLLSHTAGFTHEAPEGSNFLVGRTSFAAHCASIANTWLRFPVGHHYEYSNLGIDLAARVVQQVSGKRFERFAQEELFDPLGLERTTFDHRVISADNERAIGHDPDIPRPPLRMPMVGAGGVYTSIDDACRFVSAHLRGQVAGLGPAELAELVTVPYGAPDQVLGYGLGTVVAEVDGIAIHGHSGGGFGFLSDMYWAPEAKLGIVVLTNSEDHDLPWRFATGVIGDLVGRQPTSAQEPLPTVTIPPSTMHAVTGQYVGRFDVVDITATDEDCVFTRAGASTCMRFIDPRTFAGEDRPSDRFALRDADQDGDPWYLTSLTDGTTWYRNALPGMGTQDGPADGPWNRTYAVRRNGTRVATVRLRRGIGGTVIDDRYGNTLRLTRHRADLYVSSTGEALDLARNPITYANIRLERIS